jgi:voltage-gated potassium channel
LENNNENHQIYANRRIAVGDVCRVRNAPRNGDGETLFFGYSIAIAARQVLFTGNVDGNKIIGAIVIYLLIGMTWSFAYLLVEQLQSGSLNGLPHSNWQDNLHTVIYYSFVSLTALGYGDITPAQPLTRFLAYTEAMVGQLYLAILVASLIGARLKKQPK